MSFAGTGESAMRETIPQWGYVCKTAWRLFSQGFMEIEDARQEMAIAAWLANRRNGNAGYVVTSIANARKNIMRAASVRPHVVDHVVDGEVEAETNRIDIRVSIEATRNEKHAAVARDIMAGWSREDAAQRNGMSVETWYAYARGRLRAEFGGRGGTE